MKTQTQYDLTMEQLCAALERMGARHVCLRRSGGEWELDVDSWPHLVVGRRLQDVLAALVSQPQPCGRCGAVAERARSLCAACDSETVVLRCDVCASRTRHCSCEGALLCEGCGVERKGVARA